MLQHFFRTIPRANGIERAPTPPSSLGISPAVSTKLQFVASEFPRERLQTLHRGTSMSISGILGSSSNQYQLSSSNLFQQDLQQLSQALQSGNLSSAQSEFAPCRQPFRSPPPLLPPPQILPPRQTPSPKPSTSSAAISSRATFRPRKRITPPSNRISRTIFQPATSTITTTAVAEAEAETQAARTPCFRTSTSLDRASPPATSPALNRPTPPCSNNCNSSPSVAKTLPSSATCPSR